MRYIWSNIDMKKKWILIAGGLAVLGLIAGLLIYFFVYNKPHQDYSKARPEFEMEAFALFEAFRNDPQATSTLYNGKVIAITGELSAVENADGLTIAVFEISDGMFGSEGIRCTLLPESAEKITGLADGTKVTIKGLCTGYNETDIILEHCSLVE